MYGKYDNFSLENSHVVPGIIHRMHLDIKNRKCFMMYGTGKPLRQFIYTNDLARIIRKVLFDYRDSKPIICCGDDEISIKDLTYLIADINGYDNKYINNDLSKSDGAMKKTVDNSYLKSLFPNFKFTPLREGLTKTIEWFTKKYDTGLVRI